MMTEPGTVTLQVRLTDRFGDNGMISVVIARPTDQEGELAIDTWLMSCRVLGRQVEHAVLNILADEARQAGYRFLKGEYRPTPKNSLVQEHYEKLGFEPVGAGEEGQTFWRLSLDEFSPFPTFIAAMETSG